MSEGRASYRGVRWRRDDAGTMAWFNDGRGRWVRWYPGADAPPPPPRWAAVAAPIPSVRARPPWRSPYRLVPIALAVFVVAAGVWQATRSTEDPVRAETRAAERLVGRCLAQDGTLDGRPRYKPSPVPCELPVADVEVRSVIVGTPGGPTCPSATTPVQIQYAGVRYPHIECVEPVATHG